MKKITDTESQKKVCIITSKLGSRERFGGGKTPRDTYGKSKCYLNDKFRKVEPEWRKHGVQRMVLHTGWVVTEMGGTAAQTTKEEYANGRYKECVKMK